MINGVGRKSVSADVVIQDGGTDSLTMTLDLLSTGSAVDSIVSIADS